MQIPVFFHDEQLEHKPLYEWAFGNKMDHPETSHRAEKILAALTADAATFSIRPPAEMSLATIRQLHDPGLLTLLAQSETLPEGETFHPSVFPRSAPSLLDPSDIRHAGYYCFDSGSPLARTTWRAALWSAACAEFAAREVTERGQKLAYALSRPPGHHASPASFGGYCYFNNAAVATMKMPGKVALLDIDFHHGNGTQDMFYEDDRVLFISIHGDPREFYPYYWGFESERGRGRGEGFTINVPLPRGTDGQTYMDAIERRILPAIKAFGPDSLVVSAGFDTFVRDPIGDFDLETSDFQALGARLGRLHLPTVVVQEGGYWIDELGVNVAAFLRGMREEIGGGR